MLLLLLCMTKEGKGRGVLEYVCMIIYVIFELINKRIIY